MHYIFVVNSRSDKGLILEEVVRQTASIQVSYEIYKTEGPGDATRFVNIYCDLHPKDEVCFVACGGAGTLNEVVTGLVGKENKSLAVLSWTGTNDFIKCFPGKTFQSVDAMLKGEVKPVDVIKVNDNYAINCVNVGMDAMVATLATSYSEMNESRPYDKGLLGAVLFHRYNKIKMVADGEVLSRRRMLMSTISNGQWTGGQFHCAPDAVVDDGLMNVCFIKIMPLVVLLLALPLYTAGKHITSPFCHRHMKFRKVRHIDVTSKDLVYLCLDGEIIAASEFSIDILDKAVNFIVPAE